MPEMKKYTVFGNEGRLGVLAAPARFLDPRMEKTIQLDSGGEISVRSDKLEVQPDGSFYLHSSSLGTPTGSHNSPESTQETPNQASSTGSARKIPVDKLFRDGYSIERVKIDQLIKEPVSQRQEGETLILPVMEEVYVVEKRIMLREEIRITRVRDEVIEVKQLELQQAS